jgi:hypothetical protein
MNKVTVLFFYGLILLTSCNKRPNISEVIEPLDGSRASKDQTIKLDTEPSISRYSINYSDSLRVHDKKLLADTSSQIINCKGDIVAYRINSVTKEVIRICAKKTDHNEVNQLIVNDKRFHWDKANGFPNEFVRDYVFSDLYDGGGLGGCITKFKFRILKNKLQYVDSISGGSYSEGAGTWEWLIDDDAEPKTIVFNGGDSWLRYKNELLITPDGSSKTYLIDLKVGDTSLSFNRPGNDIFHQFILKDKLLFSTGLTPRNNFLKCYDSDAKLEWSVETDYLNKIVIDTANSIVIGSGYYFEKANNNDKGYFTIAFDLKTGKRLWDFPTAKAYNPETVLNHMNVRDLFQVNPNTYALITGLDSSPNSYKLILFDKDGKVFKHIDLPDFVLDTSSYSYDNKFSVIYKQENQFEIVNKHRTTRFKIYTSQQ